MEKSSSVSIVKCERYSDCFKYVKEAVDMLGGIEKFVKKGDRVVIKPNLVSRKDPDEAATTHPEIVKAVSRLALDAGGIVTIAESPGGPYSAAMLCAVSLTCARTRSRLSCEMVRVVPSISANAATALYVVPAFSLPIPMMTGSVGEVRRVTSPCTATTIWLAMYSASTPRCGVETCVDLPCTRMRK